MFCSKCGTELIEGAVFCQKCGAKVDNEKAMPVEAVDGEATVEKAVSEENVSPQTDTSVADNKKVKNLDVILNTIGPNKVKVIGVVRDWTGLGLKEAKDLVDHVPALLKKNVTEVEAESIKATFMREGAAVTFKNQKGNDVDIIPHADQQPMDIPIPDAKGQQDSEAVAKTQQTPFNNTAKVDDEADNSFEESDKSKSEKAINKLFEKFGGFLRRFVEWHKKSLKENKVPTIFLIIAEIALVIWLLFKTWVALVVILIIASIVLPFIMKHDFTDKDRQNSKEVITGFAKLIVGVIIIVVIILNWNSISSIWNPGAVVRNAYFLAYSEEITIGEAFENVFTDCKWSKYTYNGNEYVRFTGKLYDDNSGTVATYQFNFLVMGDSATIDSIYCDGLDVSWMETVLLVSIYNRNGVSW